MLQSLRSKCEGPDLNRDARRRQILSLNYVPKESGHTLAVPAPADAEHRPATAPLRQIVRHFAGAPLVVSVGQSPHLSAAVAWLCIPTIIAALSWLLGLFKAQDANAPRMCQCCDERLAMVDSIFCPDCAKLSPLEQL